METVQFQHLLRQPLGGKFHLNPQVLNLHVWWLKGQSCLHDEEIAKRIAYPQRSSTHKVYQSKFRLFHEWCNKNSVSSSISNVEDIKRFFWYLFDGKKLDPGTIQGYRAALANCLYGKVQWDISHDPDLTRLLFRSTQVDQKSADQSLHGTYGLCFMP